MLFRQDTLAKIGKGEVTVAFRVWEKARVKPGGRQRTPVGELRIGTVAEMARDRITEADARAAGFASVAALLAEPMLARPGRLWRVAFTLHSDVRVALRDNVPDRLECAAISDRLSAMAKRAAFDPLGHLALIADNPGRRAPDLAAGLGIETQAFKRQVRRLKELGLTESLAVGYRLSPRGAAVLAHARDRDAAP